MSHTTIPRYLALPIGLLLLASACGGSPTSPGAMGTLNVSIKDSPFSDAKALLVSFSVVSAHLSGGDFITLPFADGAASRTCDLKKLVSATDVLGAGMLPVGHYTEIRLVVSSATLYFDNPSSGAACAASIATPAGTSAPVTIPSGEVKLNNQFDLTANVGANILLDFDGDQSVKLSGGTYMMTPVISVVSVTSVSK
jgi:hypothetical protein